MLVVVLKYPQKDRLFPYICVVFWLIWPGEFSESDLRDYVWFKRLGHKRPWNFTLSVGTCFWNSQPSCKRSDYLRLVCCQKPTTYREAPWRYSDNHSWPPVCPAQVPVMWVEKQILTLSYLNYSSVFWVFPAEALDLWGEPFLLCLVLIHEPKNP